MSSDGVFSKIVVGVVVALVASGSSPWWWCKVFSCSAQTQMTLSKIAGYTGQMGPLEEGISYNQGDMYDQPAASPQDCQVLCYNDDRCVAVTFIKSQHRCWVKNTIGPIGRSGDMVSSRKLPK